MKIVGTLRFVHPTGLALTHGSAALKSSLSDDNVLEDKLKAFDWHGDPITQATPITTSYRNTQNVRRFFRAECGEHFKFDRSFMAWIKAAKNKTMGYVVKEWFRRERA